MRLHRHEDVAPEDRDLTVDETIVVGAENNGTKTVRLDLAGITLRASDTVFAVRHAALILLNANAESASSIIVESAGDAVAICQDGTADLTIGSTSSTWPGTVRIEATSTAGNAIGVYATAG
ncbi:MAG: hypothetical protein IIW35_01650, partial [Bacteroidaceae bacterium]|nr:hypothetical protein [Bacteroidaceae bacterium]